MEGHYQTIV